MDAEPQHPTTVEAHVAAAFASPGGVPVELIDHLGAEIERAARYAVEGMDPARRPLRAPKSRLSDVLRCPRLVVANLGAPDPEPGVSLLEGHFLDLLVAHHLAVGVPDEPWDVIPAALSVSDDEALSTWVGQLGGDDLERWIHWARDRRDALVHTWGAARAEWWPRAQSPATVVMADGAVVLSGKFDVEFGGRPAQRPTVVVEVKSQLPRDDHRMEIGWYALLATLRDRAAPAAVGVWYGDGRILWAPVDGGLLESAGRRAVAAIDALGALGRGVEPAERPGTWCRWCADAAVCDTGIAWLGSSDREGAT